MSISRMVEFTCVPCPHCKISAILELPLGGIISWQRGMHIQDAFPELNADQRELILTGLHSPDCWCLCWS